MVFHGDSLTGFEIWQVKFHDFSITLT